LETDLINSADETTSYVKNSFSPVLSDSSLECVITNTLSTGDDFPSDFISVALTEDSDLNVQVTVT
jgi:hypothetical protein